MWYVLPVKGLATPCVLEETWLTTTSPRPTTTVWFGRQEESAMAKLVRKKQNNTKQKDHRAFVMLNALSKRWMEMQMDGRVCEYLVGCPGEER